LPFIDDEHGGSINGMINGADELLSLTNENSKIIPGHGQLSTKKDLADYRQMLVTIRDRILNGINQGKTVDEIVAMDPTKEFTAVFQRKDFVRSVYNSLKK